MEDLSGEDRLDMILRLHCPWKMLRGEVLNCCMRRVHKGRIRLNHGSHFGRPCAVQHRADDGSRVEKKHSCAGRLLPKESTQLVTVEEAKVSDANIRLTLAKK